MDETNYQEYYDKNEPLPLEQRLVLKIGKCIPSTVWKAIWWYMSLIRIHTWVGGWGSKTMRSKPGQVTKPNHKDTGSKREYWDVTHNLEILSPKVSFLFFFYVRASRHLMQ